MKYKKYLYTSILFFFLQNHLLSQTIATDLAIGQWKSHLPYQVGLTVTQSADKVFYGTPYSLTIIDKNDYSSRFLDKLSGLSDIGVKLVRFNPANQKLLIAYNNSNIDLLQPDGTVSNLNQIKANSNIVGDKEVYHIYYDQQYAYLSCGFGMVKLDTDTEDFIYTTFTDTKVNATTIYQGFIYAATENGLFRVPVNSNLNLADFSFWQRMDTEEGFPETYSSRAVIVYKDRLYVDVNNTLSIYQDDILVPFHEETDSYVVFLSAEGEHLLAGFSCIGDNCLSKVLLFDENGASTTASSGCVNRATYAVESANGGIWYANLFQAYRFSYPGSSDCNAWTFNSPLSGNSSDIEVFDGKVYVASGGVNASGYYLFRGDGFFTLIDGQWRIYNQYSDQVMKDNSAHLDMYRLAVHPDLDKFYVGSYYGGLIEVTEGEVTNVYTTENSPMQDYAEEPGRERVGGLAFDQDSNLWITNTGADKPLTVIRADGEWQSFSLPQKSLSQLITDNNGYKWATVFSSNGGVVVFDEGDNPDITTDDKFRFITNSNSRIPSLRINSIALDKEGDVWVGTNEGVVVFQCGNDPFSNNCIGSRPIVEQDGIPAYLLESEDVRCIAVDGGNRKWFGTSNGVFVQSPEGRIELAHFTVDNSPLFDNNITDIAIDGKSGEVYIGTGKGIISYRGEAVDGGIVNDLNAYAFPNPVRPEYEGPIAIRGLAQDANVKITDISGNLIYETKSLGGQAIWDGKDYNGRKASSGVYLVFSTGTNNFDVPDALVTKILVMR